MRWTHNLPSLLPGEIPGYSTAKETPTKPASFLSWRDGVEDSDWLTQLELEGNHQRGESWREGKGGGRKQR